jgi:putative ABC transport system permease protein
MDFATIAVIVILVSVIASLQPAFKASRMEPIVALRHV